MSDFGYFQNKNILAQENLTVSTGNQVLTETVYNGSVQAAFNQQREYPMPNVQRAKGAVLEAHGSLYYTFDGSTPTSTNVHHLATDGVLMILGYEKLKALKMVRGGGSDVTISVTYYK